MDKKRCTALLRSMKRRPLALTRFDRSTLVWIKKNYPRLTRGKPWCDVVYPLIDGICRHVILPTQERTGLFKVRLPATNIIINHQWDDTTWILKFTEGPDIVASTHGNNPDKWTCYPVCEFPEADYSLNQVDAPLRLVGAP